MSQDKNNSTHDKSQGRESTGGISRNLNDATVTSMAECFAVQQGIINIPTFNGKNMPLKDFIQDTLNRECNVPGNCERQYVMGVLAQLRSAPRDSTHNKIFSRINKLIQYLKQRLAPHKTYSVYVCKILTIRMSRNKNASEFSDRITDLKSGVHAALEDKYQNAQ